MNKYSWIKSSLLIVLATCLVVQLVWANQAQEVLKQYQSSLSRLSTQQPESIPKAVHEYHARFDLKDEQTVRDKAFQAFLTFYGQVLEGQKDVNPIANVPFDVPVDGGFGMNLGKYREAEGYYNRNGLAITTDEGIWYLVDNPRYIKDNFQTSLSPGWNDYLDLKILESNQKFASDAAILIPWDDIRKRIIAWEGFMKKYPTFPLSKEIQEHRNNYIEFYLGGMANTSAFDFNSKRLNQKVRKSFERFMAENSQSSAFPLIKGYYQTLKDNNFKDGCHVTQYLASQKIIPFPDSWYKKRTIVQMSQTQSDSLQNLQKRVTLLGDGRVEPLGQGKYAIELPAESNSENIALVLKSNSDETVFFRVLDRNGQWVQSDLLMSDIEGSSVDLDGNGNWGVKVQFSSDGAAKLSRVTGNLAKKQAPLGIFRNETLLSSPKVTNAIHLGEIYISGDFEYEQALELAATLSNSPLPSPVQILESTITQPKPPQDSECF